MAMTLDTLTLPPNNPIELGADLGQESFVSTANRMHTYDAFDSPQRVIKVTVRRVTSTLRASIESHYTNTAHGKKNSFFIILHGSKYYPNVHYNKAPRFREQAAGYWQVDFEFIQPAGA